MRILTVNTFDIEGGAARAAYRLHRALLANDIDSQMLVQAKSSDDFTVILASDSKIQKGLAKLRPTLDALPVKYYKNRTKTLFSSAYLPSFGLADKINALEPDVVHLHWVADGMLRIEDISKIKAPIVWSLHDMWAFTGGCHYDEECEGYKNHCGNCKVLGSEKKNDLSAKIFQRKIKVFSNTSNLTIVGLSRWMTQAARQSSLFKNIPIVNLPNSIDTEKFSPLAKSVARDLFSLPHDKKLVLFGAMGATSDPRKGFKKLSSALQNMDIENTELVIFGSSKPRMSQSFKQKAHYLGQLHDDVSLRVLYSAADVVVVPSLQENLSNAIMESMACGTPVVGFDIGGNGDLIDHQQNGYLAKPFDINDLANGIDWVLNAKNYKQLCETAREKVMNTFDSRLVAKQYIDLYQNTIDGRKKSICSENI
jgi:glycosyltransferase involved in cell wall biosynthesis